MDFPPVGLVSLYLHVYRLVAGQSNIHCSALCTQYTADPGPVLPVTEAGAASHWSCNATSGFDWCCVRREGYFCTKKPPIMSACTFPLKKLYKNCNYKKNSVFILFCHLSLSEQILSRFDRMVDEYKLKGICFEYFSVLKYITRDRRLRT